MLLPPYSRRAPPRPTPNTPFWFCVVVLFCLKEPKGEKLPSCKVLKEEMRFFIKMLKAGGESNVQTLACYLWD